MATFTLNGTKSIVKPTLDVIRSLFEIMIRKITLFKDRFIISKQRSLLQKVALGRSLDQIIMHKPCN